MKKALLFSLGVIAFAIISFTDPVNTIVGRWQQKFSGITAVTIYRADGTFDILVNGKVFVNGKYKVNGDTLAISDPKCGVGYYGTYQLTFITPDSTRQTLIQDTCRIRRNTISEWPANGRIKPTKP